MRRRDVVAGIALTTSWPPCAYSQPQKLWRIGHVLGPRGAVEHLARALEESLAKAGYVTGRSIVLTHRFAEPDVAQFADAIAALVPTSDVLVLWSSIAAAARKRVASTLPTIFLSVGDPVAIGVAQSLAHPGGYMTGVTFEAAMETYGKRLQLLTLLVPQLKRVAVLRTAGDPNVGPATPALERAAEQLHVQLLPVQFATITELDGAFAEATRLGAEAIIVVTGAVTFAAGQRIADLALAHRLPSAHGFKKAVASGGLVSVGPDFVAMTQQGASYVDKIIKGASPADLPIEQPTRYEVHLNLRTAEALGLTVPSGVIASADEVIE